MPDSNALLDPLSLFRLDGKVALVTGASSGLGDRFARVLAAVGARIVVAARRTDRLEALVAELPDALAVACDVGVAADRERLVSSVLAHYGTIDVLVNNAGVGRPVPIERESLEEFERAIEVNLTAIWHFCKMVGEHMVAKGSGSIINVGSMLGTVASSGTAGAHYGATKGGVVNLSRELAVQWGRKGVRVNTLAPGWFLTEMTAGMDTDEGSIRFVDRNCPMRRMGELEELDGALLLLASPAGGYMTGSNLIVDGGWTAR